MLEYVPSRFKVIQHVRPKLSCRSCETIVQAPMPSLPIERGRPGPGLIAHVLVSKYCDHTPLHRQSVIYAREGVQLDRATLADWVRKAEFLLAPLAEMIGRHVSAGAALHADDTTVPVLAPGLGKTKTGRLWVVVRDERPWGSVVPPAAFSLLGESHGHPCGGAAWHLPGLSACRWICRVRRLYRPTTPNGEPTLVEVACWSHARRKFYEVHHATASPIALEALERIAALFAIESSIRGRPSDQRGAAREEHARPLLVRLKTFLDTSLNRVSGKSALAQAIRYTRSRWQALTRYVTDGRLEMSNDAAERAMKPPGPRKEKLFVLRLRRGWTARRLHLQHHRDRQDVRHQSAGLSGRCPRPHR